MAVNNVSLIGTLVTAPQTVVEPGGHEACLMQIEVPRRSLVGGLQPGVIYVDVRTFGELARLCVKDIGTGDRIGVSGTLERDDSLDRGPRRSRWEVHAHQVDFLEALPGPGTTPPSAD
jgi:single-stranded DNA-binding protein